MELKQSIGDSLEELEEADVVIGILTKNVEPTILHVMNVVREGILQYLSPYNTLIVVSDGFSTDRTAEIDREWVKQNSPLSLAIWAKHVIRTSYSVDQIKRLRLPSKTIARILGSDKTIDADDLPSASEALESHIQSTPSFNRQRGRSKP